MQASYLNTLICCWELHLRSLGTTPDSVFWGQFQGPWGAPIMEFMGSLPAKHYTVPPAVLPLLRFLCLTIFLCPLSPSFLHFLFLISHLNFCIFWSFRNSQSPWKVRWPLRVITLLVLKRTNSNWQPNSSPGPPTVQLFTRQSRNASWCGHPQ